MGLDSKLLSALSAVVDWLIAALAHPLYRAEDRAILEVSFDDVETSQDGQTIIGYSDGEATLISHNGGYSWESVDKGTLTSHDGGYSWE